MPIATKLSVYVGEDDTWHHKPLHHEIVRRAKEAGLAGATVLRGCEGYRAGSPIHTTRILSLAEDLPVVVVVVDADDRIRDFLPALAELAGDRLVTLEDVEVVHFPEPAR
ncbi:DUF190 domain-containing protein [Amycolatopsis acidicola]|uniref:DUF190 domain-containing protein n=1 Tax=Amycolatopsis acidicola TaxID=2596893 RepID=A0A5N0UVC0_9PSEU|nr:DUF190 domain-containing protein [Amycolatopsis acidicola]KAA9154324.1 DUF190 domain-containing protein [Amycolatopsis acidicola]